MPCEKYMKGYATIISKVGHSPTKYYDKATIYRQYNKMLLNMFELVTLANGTPSLSIYPPSSSPL